jgi:hypothetical protein
LLLKKAGFKNVVDRNFVKAYVLQLIIEKGILSCSFLPADIHRYYR